MDEEEAWQFAPTLSASSFLNVMMGNTRLEQLRQAFGLDDSEELHGSFNCAHTQPKWSARFLQGQLYVFSSVMVFHANLIALSKVDCIIHFKDVRVIRKRTLMRMPNTIAVCSKGPDGCVRDDLFTSFVFHNRRKAYTAMTHRWTEVSPEHANAYLGPPGCPDAVRLRSSEVVSESDCPYQVPTRRTAHHRRGSSAARHAGLSGDVGSIGSGTGSVHAVQPFPTWPPAVQADCVPAAKEGDMTMVTEEDIAGVDPRAFAEVLLSDTSGFVPAAYKSQGGKLESLSQWQAAARNHEYAPAGSLTRTFKYIYSKQGSWGNVTSQVIQDQVLLTTPDDKLLYMVRQRMPDLPAGAGKCFHINMRWEVAPLAATPAAPIPTAAAAAAMPAVELPRTLLAVVADQTGTSQNSPLDAAVAADIASTPRRASPAVEPLLLPSDYDGSSSPYQQAAAAAAAAAAGDGTGSSRSVSPADEGFRLRKHIGNRSELGETSDLRSVTSDLRSVTSDLRSQTSDLRSQISDMSYESRSPSRMFTDTASALKESLKDTTQSVKGKVRSLKQDLKAIKLGSKGSETRTNSCNGVSPSDLTPVAGTSPRLSGILGGQETGGVVARSVSADSGSSSSLPAGANASSNNISFGGRVSPAAAAASGGSSATAGDLVTNAAQSAAGMAAAAAPTAAAAGGNTPRSPLAANAVGVEALFDQDSIPTRGDSGGSSLRGSGRDSVNLGQNSTTAAPAAAAGAVSVSQDPVTPGSRSSSSPAGVTAFVTGGPTASGTFAGTTFCTAGPVGPEVTMPSLAAVVAGSPRQLQLQQGLPLAASPGVLGLSGSSSPATAAAGVDGAPVVMNAPSSDVSLLQDQPTNPAAAAAGLPDVKLAAVKTSPAAAAPAGPEVSPAAATPRAAAAGVRLRVTVQVEMTKYHLAQNKIKSDTLTATSAALKEIVGIAKQWVADERVRQPLADVMPQAAAVTAAVTAATRKRRQGHPLHRTFSKRAFGPLYTGHPANADPEAAMAAACRQAELEARAAGTTTTSSSGAAKPNTGVAFVRLAVSVVLKTLKMAWEVLGLKDLPWGTGVMLGLLLLGQLLLMWRVVSLQGRVVYLLELQQEWQQQQQQRVGALPTANFTNHV